MQKGIHIYSSQENQQLRATAERLADNLTKPVFLHGLDALPAPDRQRPTKQQLRTALAGVQQELDACRNLIRLAQPHPVLADELGKLRQEEARHEKNIQELVQQLGEQRGGPLDG